LLEDLLSAVLIVPEIWFANLCFRLLKLGRFSLRVKETSAAPPREPPGLGTFVAVLRSSSVLVERRRVSLAALLWGFAYRLIPLLKELEFYHARRTRS
jgi:hypothetical protein